jgi:hypothetical protein
MRVARAVLLAGLSLSAAAIAPVTPAIAQAPAASFLWFPAAPHNGEAVSLASTSTDADSPITSVAWDLTGAGVFQEGGAVVSTSFSTPGAHVVQLRVTDAAGYSSTVAETIEVSSPPAPELLPAPIVRIAGTPLSSGVRLRLLSVETPPGARITVRCLGRGCPVRAQSLVATSMRVETVAVGFRRFERLLPAGVTLEIRVSKRGYIGKYTRLVVRRGRPPARLDACLDPTGTPIKCPVAAGP